MHRSIRPKHGSTLNTHNDFIRSYIERVTSNKRKITLLVTMKGDGGVAGEGRLCWYTKISFMK